IEHHSGMLPGRRTALLRIGHRAAERPEQQPAGVRSVDVIIEAQRRMADISHALPSWKLMAIPRVAGVIDELDLRQNEAGRLSNDFEKVWTGRIAGIQR